MSIISMISSLPEIPPSQVGATFYVTGYDGVKTASSSKYCLGLYAEFCKTFKFITEKVSDDGYTVVYWLSHPIFAMKFEKDYPEFKIFIGEEGTRNDVKLDDGRHSPPLDCEWRPFVVGQGRGVKFAKATGNYVLHLDIVLHYSSAYIYFLKYLEEHPKESV